MKRVIYVFAACAGVFFLNACNETTTNSLATGTSQDLAVAEIPSEEKETYLYVTAGSGLSLREFNNLSSEKLAIMPYGTKLKVLSKEEQATMTVAGIKGAMNKVAYNHKEGFAFTGYLSKFFPPEEDIRPIIYAEDLKKQFPAVSFTEATGGSASQPTNTETLTLPTQEWHEAFFIAQQLYDIPKSFAFPTSKGRDLQSITNSRPTPSLWVSELEVERTSDVLQKITYRYAGEGYGSNVTITKDGDMMKIEHHTVSN